MTSLLGLTPEALAVRLESPGRARNVFRLLTRGRDPFEALPTRARQRLAAAVQMMPLSLRASSRAADGTVKLLLELEDGARVETVLIPEKSRTTICVSTQVGCARGCRFCLTATMMLQRNLRADEIVGQVFAGIRGVQSLGLPPLRNIVFMGMGEPLDNPDATRTALEILTTGFGFGPRHVTVSTVAPSPRAVARLAGWPAHVAWSLHAADDDVRRRLIPTARSSVRELLDAFAALSLRSLFVEVALMDGVNDRPEDADRIARLFDGFPAEVRLNLLPMNRIREVGSSLEPSRAAAVQAFQNRLREAGYFCIRRRARGTDADAACGQLATLSSGRS